MNEWMKTNEWKRCRKQYKKKFFKHLTNKHEIRVWNCHLLEFWFSFLLCLFISNAIYMLFDDTCHRFFYTTIIVCWLISIACLSTIIDLNFIIFLCVCCAVQIFCLFFNLSSAFVNWWFIECIIKYSVRNADDTLRKNKIYEQKGERD